MYKIDSFSVADGWRRVDSPFPDDWADWDKVCGDAGYEHFDDFGNDCATHIQIMRRSQSDEEGFLVAVWSVSGGMTILVSDTPSLINLLGQLEPMVRMSVATFVFEELIQFADLLKDHRARQARESRERKATPPS
jgi:hypothetical protein